MLKQNSEKRIKGKKKGQSTVEYIILVAAVIAIVLTFLGPNGVFQTAVNSTLTSGVNGMTNAAGRISGVFKASPLQ